MSVPKLIFEVLITFLWRDDWLFYSFCGVRDRFNSTDSINRLRKSIFCVVVNTDLLKLMMNSRCCSKNITVYLAVNIAWIVASRRTRYFIIPLFNHLNIDVGSFNNFEEQDVTQDTGTIWNKSLFLNLSLNGLKSMHRSGLVCEGSLLNVTWTLDNAAHLFWNAGTVHICFFQIYDRLITFNHFSSLVTICPEYLSPFVFKHWI